MLRCTLVLILMVAALGGCNVVPVPDSVEACAFVPLASIPIVLERNKPMIAVMVDGQPARMMLDTGAEQTMVSESSAKRLELQTDWSRLGNSFGIGGQTIHYGVTADSIDIGALRLRRQSISVGLVNWPDGLVRPDGFLGANILSQYDADIDLPHGRLTLYRPRDCSPGGPPWRTAYQTLPIRYVSREHNLVAMDVELDGKKLVATIDTGSQTSVVARRAAADTLGLNLAAMDRERGDEMFGVGPDRAVSHQHAFPEARIAGEMIRGPTLPVVELPSTAGDMLLGADFLRSHRIFLSYVTGRLFLAPAAQAQAKP